MGGVGDSEKRVSECDRKGVGVIARVLLGDYFRTDIFSFVLLLINLYDLVCGSWCTTEVVARWVERRCEFTFACVCLYSRVRCYAGSVMTVTLDYDNETPSHDEEVYLLAYDDKAMISLFDHTVSSYELNGAIDLVLCICRICCICAYAFLMVTGWG